MSTTTAPQHTPGPWTLQQLTTEHRGYDWQTFAIRSPQNVCLAIVGEVDRFESERIPANARLIAAAPELLDASLELLNVLREMPKGPQHEAMVKVYHAIAKATGTA